MDETDHCWRSISPGWADKAHCNENRVSARNQAEAGFTSSSGGVRAPSVNAKKELSGEERKAGEKPLQVRLSSSGWFQAWANRSYPEGRLVATVYQHGTITLAAPKRSSAKRKTPKGGTN